VKVVDRPSSNCCRGLEWWAAEGSACNHYGGSAEQYDSKGDMAADEPEELAH
jgi:hypothetical protein